MLLREPDAGIAHRQVQGHLVIRLFSTTHQNRHLTPVGELHRIVGVIDQNLTDPGWVANQPLGHTTLDVKHEFQAFGHAFVGYQVGDVFQHRVQTEFDPLHRKFAGLDLGKIQDVVDDPEQMSGRTLDFLHIVALARRQLGFKRQVTHADDGVHRGAYLMAHIGQEIRLHSGAFCGFIRGHCQCFVLGPQVVHQIINSLTPDDALQGHQSM